MLTFALTLLTLRGGRIAPPTHAVIAAGTVVHGGTTLVRLRWFMDEGWIPDGGFNLYRSSGGAAPVKLNAAPLKIAAADLSDPIIQSAMTPIAVVGQQQFLNAPGRPRGTSAPTFSKLRDTAKSAAGLKTGEKAIRSALATSPDFKAFAATLPKTPPVKTSYSQVEQVGLARSQVVLGEMTIPGFAERAGLGFDDKQAQTGAAYTYTLKAINAGVESAVIGTLPFTVGADALPPAPLVEEPIQVSAHVLNLHFEVPPAVSEAAFGALWFQVTRFDVKTPNGLNLSTDPILASYIATSDGKQTPALTSMTDSPAGYGAVKYNVQLVDAFGRIGAATTVQTTFADIASPAPVLGAGADVPGKRGAGSPVPTITFMVSAGDSSVALPNAEPIQYKIERQSTPDKPNAKTANTPWTAVGGGAVDGTPIDPTTLKVHDLIKLSVKFRSLVATTCVPKGLTKAKAQAAFVALEQSQVSAAIAKYPALAAPVKAFVLRQTTDTGPSFDSYCVYRVTPVMKRNGLQGDAGVTSILGVPAAQSPTPPGSINFSDAPAPLDVSKVAGSKTNAVRLQPVSGTFPPSATRPSGDSKALGQQMLASHRAAAKMSASNAYTSVAPANYGRMVTLSWGAPGYSSPLKFKVYKGFGTGFTPGAHAETIVGDEGLRASAELAQVAPPFDGKNLVGHGVLTSLTKSQYHANTAPAATGYVMLGETKAGETTFVDFIPRSYVSTVYYYVVPVSRWGVDGKASPPSAFTVKESLPPTVPVVQSIQPTTANSIQATVQPNLTSVYVVEYGLLGAPLTQIATVSTASNTGSGVHRGGPERQSLERYVGKSRYDDRSVNVIRWGSTRQWSDRERRRQVWCRVSRVSGIRHRGVQASPLRGACEQANASCAAGGFGAVFQYCKLRSSRFREKCADEYCGNRSQRCECDSGRRIHVLRGRS